MVGSQVSAFFAWLDRRHFVSVRAGMQYVTVFMTYEVTKWAFAYASVSSLPGIELAAVIAAVTVPFCALQAAVFNFYMTEKKS